MSRPLRLLYLDAWYHVMNRGRNREALYTSDEDYRSFVELLKESTSLWGIRISAYCLMPNHYHLLLQTPEANLDRCMRHINGIYTQRFNRRHKKEGPLFRGRYKSILVEEDSYILQLVKYIHRNPVHAGLITDLKKYPWSSHKGYLSPAKEGAWLYTAFIVHFFGKDQNDSLAAYRKYIMQEDAREILEIFSTQKLIPILGSESFKGWVREKFSSLAHQQEMTEAKILAIKTDDIKGLVAEVFDVDKASLSGVRRKAQNDPRDVAVYLTRQYRRDTLEKIGSAFGISKYSTVSTILLNMKERLLKDRPLRKKVSIIENKLLKSQRQI